MPDERELRMAKLVHLAFPARPDGRQELTASGIGVLLAGLVGEIADELERRDAARPKFADQSSYDDKPQSAPPSAMCGKLAEDGRGRTETCSYAPGHRGHCSWWNYKPADPR